MKNRNWLTLQAIGILSVAIAFSARAADSTPTARIQILQPQTNQILRGVFEVRAKIIPAPKARTPEQAYVGLGGPPWIALKRTEPSGEWVALVDSTLVPNGEQKLTALTDERRVRAAVNVLVTNALNCYWADLHSHTSFSDGGTVPARAHEYARTVSKLDVFSLTDHLESVDEEEWRDMREQAEKANQNGVFVTLPGLEWTKRWGHACIFDPQTRTWPTNIAAFYQAAANAGVVLKINHPGPGTNVFDALAYSEIGDQAVELMEVRRAQEQEAYVRALKLGWHLAPDGADDTHSANWGNVKSWSGIWAPGLSRRNILAALKARHVYSTLDRNCRLWFSINGAMMGDIVEQPAKTVKMLVRVQDPDPGDKIGKIELFEDGEVVETKEPKGESDSWEVEWPAKPGPHFYFTKITQTDTNLLWSAPIWITVAER